MRCDSFSTLGQGLTHTLVTTTLRKQVAKVQKAEQRPLEEQHNGDVATHLLQVTSGDAALAGGEPPERSNHAPVSLGVGTDITSATMQRYHEALHHFTGFYNFMCGEATPIQSNNQQCTYTIHKIRIDT